MLGLCPDGSQHPGVRGCPRDLRRVIRSPGAERAAVRTDDDASLGNKQPHRGLPGVACDLVRGRPVSVRRQLLAGAVLAGVDLGSEEVGDGRRRSLMPTTPATTGRIDPTESTIPIPRQDMSLHPPTRTPARSPDHHRAEDTTHRNLTTPLPAATPRPIRTAHRADAQ